VLYKMVPHCIPCVFFRHGLWAGPAQSSHAGFQMINSKCYYHYQVVVKYRNWYCHLHTMQISRYGNVQMLLPPPSCCKLLELVVPSVCHAVCLGTAKSNLYYDYHAVALYRNWSCHLFTMQVSRHDQVQNGNIIVWWLQMIGIGHAICLPCRFPGMTKSNI
jgi:hypothetical protein